MEGDWSPYNKYNNWIYLPWKLYVLTSVVKFTVINSGTRTAKIKIELCSLKLKFIYDLYVNKIDWRKLISIL